MRVYQRIVRYGRLTAARDRAIRPLGPASALDDLHRAHHRVVFVVEEVTVPGVGALAVEVRPDPGDHRGGRAGRVAPGTTLAGRLGTLVRPGGVLQATYDGHPLYTFAGDFDSGDVGGNGVVQFGGTWHAVRPG
jgi:hypothetical protein